MTHNRTLKKRNSSNRLSGRAVNFNHKGYQRCIRKQVHLDLNDSNTLISIGESLKPFGYKEFIENKLFQSKSRFLRYWGKIQLSKRGEKYIRRLYAKNPERFANVELLSTDRTHFRFVRGNLVISEIKQSQTISHPKDSYHTEKKYVKDVFEHQKAQLIETERMLAELMPEADRKLLGISA